MLADLYTLLIVNLSTDIPPFNYTWWDSRVSRVFKSGHVSNRGHVATMHALMLRALLKIALPRLQPILLWEMDRFISHWAAAEKGWYGIQSGNPRSPLYYVQFRTRSFWKQKHMWVHVFLRADNSCAAKNGRQVCVSLLKVLAKTHFYRTCNRPLKRASISFNLYICSTR